MCSVGCNLCSIFSTNCTECSNGYYLYYETFTCCNICPLGSYIDPSLVNKCSICNVGCVVCLTYGFNCTSCRTVAGIPYYLSANSYTCSINCPNGQFKDATLNNKCSFCDAICTSCFGFSTNCTACANNYYLKFGTY